MEQQMILTPLLKPYFDEKPKHTFSCCYEEMGEFKKQMQLAGPLVIVSVLQYSLLMMSIMFAGHLGEYSLSSASMANSYAGVTGFGFMLGMGSALETFCGQAYGAKHYHMLGIHLQRAMLVLMLMCIPIAILWSFTEQVFIFLGQDPEISIGAGIYARWLIPSIFPYGILQCQLRFLQAQNNTSPLVLTTAITTLVHLLMCYLFVFGFGFGFEGAALASSVSYWTNVLMLAIYIKRSPTCEKTWTGFSVEGRKNLFDFLSLAVPSALMVCFEFWSYEFLVLMSGFLPNPKLETSMMSLSLNATSMMYRIPFGFGSAVSTRVSNELGAGKPCAAKLAARVVILVAVIEGFLVGLLAISVRNVWGYIYTNDEKVVKYFASVTPVIVLSSFMDGIQGVLSGISRGCGWQNLGVLVNLGAYYIIGIPCAIVVTFVFHFGGKGLWMGIISGSGLQALLLLAITLRMDWEHQVKKAKDRTYASNIPIAIPS